MNAETMFAVFTLLFLLSELNLALIIMCCFAMSSADEAVLGAPSCFVY
jgi:hypothetical protein